MSIVEAAHVSVRFGGLLALDDVSLAIEPGEVTGLIGPNGAGKTTLFNVMTGLQQPATGRVSLEGRDVTRTPAHRRARLGIARTFQRLEVFDSLTVRENVAVAAEAHRRRQASGDVDVEGILDVVGLRDVADTNVDLLPTGLARLVELARALATSPKVLLCDECSSGLTDDETKVVADVVRRAADQGVAVLLVEHDMPFVMSTCDTIHVLDLGRRIAHGTPAEVQANERVREAYLGSEKPATLVAADRRVRAPTANEITPAVQLTHVRAGYGNIDVIRDLDLSVAPGEIFALLGPNGAGKSTTLKVINGQVRPSAGDVRLCGHSTVGMSVDALARAGLCTVPEGRGISPNLTVDDNLRMSTHSGIDLAEIRERAFAQFPVLGERRKQVAGTLSGGEQQMLALARAIVTEPAVLVIDELSMGLGPLIVAELYEVVAEVAETQQMSTIIVEQFAHDVLGIASRAGVMLHGRMVSVGNPVDVASELTSIYLATGIDES